MAFPQVVNFENTTGNGSSVPLNMPASIVAGRLLLAVCGIDGSRTSAAISGWAKVGLTARSLSTVSQTLAVFGKVAAGGDTGTLAPGASEEVAVTTYQITDWSGLLSEIGYAGALGPSGAAGDPPALTMPSVQDYLWFAAESLAAGIPATTPPVNYTNLIEAVTTTTAAGSSIVSARRELRVATENPGPFSGQSSPSYPIVATLAVTPSASVAPTPKNVGSWLPFF